MKEFITAVEDIEAENEREAKIVALMAEKNLSRDNAEKEIDLGAPTEFLLDGRVMHAYPLSPEQLTFMMMALGRGQTQDQRFASILNLMASSLRSDDADYFESRLLEQDPKKRLTLPRVESIFEYLMEEWFGGHPTQPSSGSASPPPSDG